MTLAARLGRQPEPGAWQGVTTRTLTRLLTTVGGPAAGFVVEGPGEPGRLAACALGVIECRLGSPDNPLGQVGYVLNVATDPGLRRRGYSRACLEALLDWYHGQGVVQVDLHASPSGQPLYRQLGFRATSSPSMRLMIDPRELTRGTAV